MTRYQITLETHDAAKARIRTALKLLGAETVRIVEIAPAVDAKPVKPDNLPTSPEAKACAALYGRPETSPWADKEIAAFRKAGKTQLLTIENMTIIEKHYRAERKREGHYCRRDLMTFLANYTTELDRAKAARPSGGKALEWQPSNVVPMPDPEETERIRTATLAQIAERRKTATP